ncbi:MAG TPA: DUF4058 family protein [Tepidisphaeraceae bacterium]|jgi:hypothetical protein
MPIHNWTLVSAGTFHAFHTSWIAEIQRSLNGGLLPQEYYALAEQVAGEIVPDVLTLQDLGGGSGGTGASLRKSDELNSGGGGIALAEAPPRVAMTDTITESMLLAARRRQLVIRHTTGDRIVAILEIVSPGNKERRSELDVFIDKAVGTLDARYHLMLIDLFPPGPFDPRGIHGALWERLRGAYNPPPGKSLTLASYRAAGPITCFVEPTAVGTPLIDMPLFLDPGHYVNVPLESTYLGAYEGVPRRWKAVIETSR